VRRAALALLVLAAAPVIAACGGGGSGTTTGATTAATTTATGPSVRVIDGDTGAPLSAEVRAIGAHGAIVHTGGDGTASVPAGTRVVRASAPHHDPGRAAVAGAADVVVRLYDPSLQSPQYGGNPQRTRYVAAVRVPPPNGKSPTWTFDGRTLLEFPPAVDGGVAVIGTNSGRVFALNVQTGRLLWARRQRGYIAATPAIAGGRVYVASMDGRLTCYRLADGQRIWQYSTGGRPIETSPLVIGDELYFGDQNGSGQGRLYAMDIRTGKMRWTFDANGAIKGSAAQAGNLVVFGDYTGNVYGLSRASGHEAWRFSGGRRFYGGPAVSGDRLVIGDVGGAIYSLDTRTGAERWSVSTGGQYVYSSPAIANGVAYVGSYDGRLRAIDVGSGAVKWTFDVGGRISGSATVVDGVVYTARLYAPGQPRRTYGLDAATGAVRYQTDDGRYSPAVGAGRTLYLVGTRRLYAYRAAPA
jgi:outer membrane protein assembly factor BamB